MAHTLHIYLFEDSKFNEQESVQAKIRAQFNSDEKVKFINDKDPIRGIEYLRMEFPYGYWAMFFFDYGDDVSNDFCHISGQKRQPKMRVRVMLAQDESNDFDDVAVTIYELFLRANGVVYDVSQAEIVPNI